MYTSLSLFLCVCSICLLSPTTSSKCGISYLEHKTNDLLRTKSTSLSVHRNLFWQLPWDGNLQGFGISRATTASPKPSFKALWRVGDAVVDRGTAGWTTSKNGNPCPWQNCSRPPVGKTERESLLNRLSCPPQRPNRSRDWTELNWTPSSYFLSVKRCPLIGRLHQKRCYSLVSGFLCK